MFVFLLGLPGAGKSSLAKALVGDDAQQVGDWTVGKKVSALGCYDRQPWGVDSLCQGLPSWGGETNLSSPRVMDLLRRAPYRPKRIYVVDNVRFDARLIRGLQWPSRVVRLDVPLAIAVHRRAQRGSPTMPFDWWSKRALRVSRDTSACGRVDTIDASQDIESVVSQWGYLLSARR